MTPLALAVPEAAEMIGVSPNKVWSLIAAGEIARTKIGRRTLIRVAELERFLVAHEDSERNETPDVPGFVATSALPPMPREGSSHE